MCLCKSSYFGFKMFMALESVKVGMFINFLSQMHICQILKCQFSEEKEVYMDVDEISSQCRPLHSLKVISIFSQAFKLLYNFFSP